MSMTESIPVGAIRNRRRRGRARADQHAGAPLQPRAVLYAAADRGWRTRKASGATGWLDLVLQAARAYLFLFFFLTGRYFLRAAFLQETRLQIGRASCRERVELS